MKGGKFLCCLPIEFGAVFLGIISCLLYVAVIFFGTIEFLTNNEPFIRILALIFSILSIIFICLTLSLFHGISKRNVKTIKIYYTKIIVELIVLILAPVICAVFGFWIVYLVGLITPFFIVCSLMIFALLQLFHIYSLVVINSLRRKMEYNIYTATVMLENGNAQNEFQDFFEQPKTEENKVYVM